MKLAAQGRHRLSYFMCLRFHTGSICLMNHMWRNEGNQCLGFLFYSTLPYTPFWYLIHHQYTRTPVVQWQLIFPTAKQYNYFYAYILVFLQDVQLAHFRQLFFSGFHLFLSTMHTGSLQCTTQTLMTNVAIST